jgi:GTP pyrophosphokinase
VKSGESEKIAKKMRYTNAEELFASVGFGKVEPHEVYDAAMAEEGAPTQLRPSLFEKTVQKVTGKSASVGIAIDDVDEVVVRYAQCCSPLPGDPITGWITRGRGVTVHRRGCARAMELDPERRIDVTWSERVRAARPVALKIITTDKPGILSNVSAVFTESGVNIQEANCRVGQDGTAVNHFHFLVDEAAKLQNLMRKIQGLDGVYSVERS